MLKLFVISGGWTQSRNSWVILSEIGHLVFPYGAPPDAVGEPFHERPLQRTEVGTDYQGGTGNSSESTESMDWFEIIYTYQLIYQLQLSKS